MKHLLPFYLCFCSVCFGLNLDTLMSPDEKKETGYNTLSKQEKKKLNEWISKNLELQSKKESSASLSLNINIQSGTELILSDGSKWEVDPQDHATSSVWLTPIPLKLVPSKSKEYPYLLINKDAEKEQVKVRPIS